MDIPLVVTKVLGIYLVVSGLFLIFRGKTLPHMLKDFYDHPAIVYLTGVILLFLSSLTLLFYNVWDGTIGTLVTVILWATLIKGLTYLFAPQVLERMVTKKLLRAVSLYGVIAVAAGIFLFYSVSL